ncbi:MAG: phosphotransferase family protein [Balneolaceae bacterium]
MISDKEFIVSSMLKNGILKNRNVKLKPLQGGVSSDIYLITEGKNKYVVKKARPKLKVKDDWYADTSRNVTEQRFMRYVRDFAPEAVPELYYFDPNHQFFVMEFLDESFKNWKQLLLDGQWESRYAVSAAALMATIHTHSRNDREAKKAFNTTSAFQSLRIEPYLLTTGGRHPELKAEFFKEARRLKNTCEALVHGDFSPKNIMVCPDRLVLLDHEVAWYGDPAFDVAFFLNHLYLKMLFHHEKIGHLPDLSSVFWSVYFEKRGKKTMSELEERIGRLLLMLMLARVDGKSPVEYLNEEMKEAVRSFVHKMLPGRVFHQAQLNQQWKSKLNSLTVEN